MGRAQSRVPDGSPASGVRQTARLDDLARFGNRSSGGDLLAVDALSDVYDAVVFLWRRLKRLYAA